MFATILDVCKVLASPLDYYYRFSLGATNNHERKNSGSSLLILKYSEVSQ